VKLLRYSFVTFRFLIFYRENALLSLKGFAALVCLIILIGCLADMLVINEEWDKFKDKLFKLSCKLKEISSNDLIFLIAKKVMSILERTNTHKSSSENEEMSFYNIRIVWVVILLTSLMILYLIINDIYYFLPVAMVFPLITISIFGFLLILFWELFFDMWNEKVDSIWRIYTKSSIFSVAITFLAILISSALFNKFIYSEYWFNYNVTHEGAISVGERGDIYENLIINFFNVINYGQIKHQNIMELINYPFDFLSLLFTYYCLKRIVNRAFFYPVYPLLDVIFSLFLSSILYSVLNSISEGGLVYSFFINDISNLNSTDFNNSKYDLIYLLPIVLSTFLPISLLASLFVFLILYKYISLILSRVFHVLSEKQGSIFKEIAFTLSAIVGLVNAVVAL